MAWSQLCYKTAKNTGKIYIYISYINICIYPSIYMIFKMVSPESWAYGWFFFSSSSNLFLSTFSSGGKNSCLVGLMKGRNICNLVLEGFPKLQPLCPAGGLSLEWGMAFDAGAKFSYYMSGEGDLLYLEDKKARDLPLSGFLSPSDKEKSMATRLCHSLRSS